MLLVDTNVLVYAADRGSSFHEACHAWLEAQRRRRDPWYATWPILYEFLRITTHPRVLRAPWSVRNAWRFIETLLASPGLDVLAQTPRHVDVAKQTFIEYPELSGNILHDAHTAILMREHGVNRICTRDADFHRFSFLEVVDPLRS